MKGSASRAAPGVAAGLLAFAAPALAQDTFAPLERYGGSWTVRSSTGKIDHLENRCSRAGDFFVCEQVLNGKAKALVLFQL